jgi:hypothetical protein
VPLPKNPAVKIRSALIGAYAENRQDRAGRESIEYLDKMLRYSVAKNDKINECSNKSA